MSASGNHIAPNDNRLHMHSVSLERSVILTLIAADIPERTRKGLLVRLTDDMFSSTGTGVLCFRAILDCIKRTRRLPDHAVMTTDPRVRLSVREFLTQGRLEPLRSKLQLDNAIDSLVGFRSKRILFEGFGRLVQNCESDTYDEASALAQAQAIVRKLSRPLGMAEMRLTTDDPETRQRVRDVLKRSQLVQKRRFSTGWPTVDRILSGGLAPAELLLLAANTGGGKSMVALAMAMHMVEQGHHVVYFSFEMREDAVFLRLAARWAGYTRAQLASGSLTPQQLNQAYEAFMRMLGSCAGTLRILTPEQGFVRPGLDTLEDIIRREPCDVVFVDYMSMLASQAGERGDNEEKRLRAASEGLVMLGATAQVAVVAMAQLDDEGKVKYSRGVRDAATMLLQWDSTQADTAEERGVIYKVEIKKQRETSGPPVQEFFVEPKFDTLRVPEYQGNVSIKKQPSLKEMGKM